MGDSLTMAARTDLTHEYHRLGWHDVQVNARGGRGIASFIFSDITGLDAVRHIKDTGFDGCWVMALGTNDTANAKQYARTPAEQKAWRLSLVRLMMAELDGAPVMWVNTHLVRGGNDYSAADAAAWNDVLAELQPSYPNMLIFDWNSVAAAHPEWTSTDLVHDTPIGSAQRAAFVAQAATLMLRDGVLPADTPPANRHPWSAWQHHIAPRHHTGVSFHS